MGPNYMAETEAYIEECERQQWIAMEEERRIRGCQETANDEIRRANKDLRICWCGLEIPSDAVLPRACPNVENSPTDS